MKQRIMNSREIKEVNKQISEQWGVDLKKAKLPYAYLTNNKKKIFIVNKELDLLAQNRDLDRLSIERLGVYLGEQTKGGFRLTIAGAQLIGPKATKNVLNIDEQEMKDWFAGQNIIRELDLKKEGLTGDGYIILKYHHKKAKMDDFVGCGRYKQHQDKWQVLNFVPKIRRIQAK